MNFTSSPKIIGDIGRALGEYANSNPEIQILESPLLGTGAGGLTPADGGNALKDGFEQACTTDATLFIYGQLSTTIQELRQMDSLSISKDEAKPFAHLIDAPIEIFFSFANEDEGLMNEIRRQLVIHERQGTIFKWHYRMILPGEQSREETNNSLERSHIFLPLLSPAFIESKYCYEVEGMPALQRNAKGKMYIIPVILRPCEWEHTPFGVFQSLPRDAKPVSLWTDLDEATHDVAKGIMSLVNKIRNRAE